MGCQRNERSNWTVKAICMSVHACAKGNTQRSFALSSVYRSHAVLILAWQRPQTQDDQTTCSRFLHQHLITVQKHNGMLCYIALGLTLYDRNWLIYRVYCVIENPNVCCMLEIPNLDIVKVTTSWPLVSCSATCNTCTCMYWIQLWLTEFIGWTSQYHLCN